jgi:hypothetical protein
MGYNGATDKRADAPTGDNIAREMRVLFDPSGSDQTGGSASQNFNPTRRRICSNG